MNDKAQVLMIIFIFAGLLALGGAIYAGKYYADKKAQKLAGEIADGIQANNDELQEQVNDLIDTYENPPVNETTQEVDYATAFWTARAKVAGLNVTISSGKEFLEAFKARYGYYPSGGGGSSAVIVTPAY